jgi:murein DD-endopeptidase MepM/ murein hydrolase activator NlpD
MRRKVVVGCALVLSLVVWAKLGHTARALIRYANEPAELLVPVAGVAPRALHSSWGEPRSGGRRHEGIDIFAPRDTPVVAAAAGEVVRVGQDRLGGNVVWVAGEGMRLYYYAHLSRFRGGLGAGEIVAAGDPLGFVGTTGNAVGTPPHLHFGVYPATHAFHAVDPAGLLRRARASR